MEPEKSLFEEIQEEIRRSTVMQAALNHTFAKMKDEIDSLIALLMDFYASLPEDLKEELKDE